MVTFSFIQYGENLGTRPLGQRVRESLLPLIEQNDLVVLDFTGVNVVIKGRSKFDLPLICVCVDC